MRSKAPNLELQRRRFAQQMSRTALSQQTGLSRRALLAVEQRQTRPRMDTAARIATALDCEIEDIFHTAEVIG